MTSETFCHLNSTVKFLNHSHLLSFTFHKETLLSSAAVCRRFRIDYWQQL